MFRRRIALFLIPMLLIASMAFGYTRDWDEADPIDHILNSKWPAEIREVMVDIAERLDDIMNGFTAGDTVTDFNVAPLNNRASDPTAVADTLQLYSKDVSSKAELFFQDEDSNAVQATTGGKLNSAVLSGTGMPSGWFDTVYPVGHVYISTVSTNPNTLLGSGTWAAFGAGKVLVGLDSGDSDFDTSEETGGAKTVTLTAAQSGLVSHNHDRTDGSASGSSAVQASSYISVGALDQDPTASAGGTAASSAHANVQPYIVVYMWERTS